MHPDDDGVGDPEAPPGLLDRILRRSAVIVIAGVLSLLIFAVGLISISRAPWELDARSPVVESSDSECGSLTGAVFTIAVEGRKYRCGGSDGKCAPDGAVAVAYDAADPSRCRVAANVDRLSELESWIVAMSCSVALFVVAGAAHLRSEGLRRADSLDGVTTRQRRRARLRRVSAVTVVAAVACSLAAVILQLLRDNS